MISKEYRKKFERQNEVIAHKINLKQSRKQRKLLLPHSNLDVTKYSDLIGDFKVTKTVQKLSTENVKRKPFRRANIIRSSEDDSQKTPKYNTDHFKLQNKQKRNQTFQAQQVEMEAFKFFLPNVFKNILDRGNSRESISSNSTIRKTGRKSTITPPSPKAAPKKVNKHPKRQKTVKEDDKKQNAENKSEQPLKRNTMDDAKKEECSLGRLSKSIRPSKPWMNYCRNAQKALSTLNNEVSLALRNSFYSIDNMQMRIRHTIDEIKQCDKMYEELKSHQQHNHSIMSFSTPESNTVIDEEENYEQLLEPTNVNLLQSQSKNPLRIPVLPSIAESIYETEIDYPKEDAEEAQEVIQGAVIEKLECRTQLIDSEETPNEYEDESRIKLLNSVKAIAQSTDHLKELETPKHMVQFIAEELFVPERINRISSAKESSEFSLAKSKQNACQFLYREKNKGDKRTANQKSTTSIKSQRYTNSVLFAKRDKRSRNSSLKSNDLCSLVINNIGHNEHKFKSEFRTLKMQSMKVKTGLSCFDILDEITLNDIKPLKSEYPRKDNNMPQLKACERVENSYLYKLINEPMVDEFSKLFEFEVPHSSINENDVNAIFPKKSVAKSKKQKKTTHDNIVTKLKPYIFDPYMCYPTTITVMPVMVTNYTNPHLVKNATKTLLKKNMVGDSVPSKQTKSQTKPLFNAEKKKVWTTKQSRLTNNDTVSSRQKPMLENVQKMRGDTWENDTPLYMISTPQMAKQRNKRQQMPYAAKPNYSRSLKGDSLQESNIQNMVGMIEMEIAEIFADSKQTFKSTEIKILNANDSFDMTNKTIQIDNAAINNFADKNCTFIQPERIHIINESQDDGCCKVEAESTHQPLLPLLESSVVVFLDSRKPVFIFFKHVLKIPTQVVVFAVYYQIYRCSTYFKQSAMIPKPVLNKNINRTYKILDGAIPDKTLELHFYKPKEPVIIQGEGNKKVPIRSIEDGTIVTQVQESFIHNKFLNYFYGSIFTIVFFALTFTYTCQ